MPFYYLKFSYNQEALASSKYRCKKTKNCKNRTTKERSRLKETTEKRFETKLKEVLN
jgi:hypothetical protein